MQVKKCPCCNSSNVKYMASIDLIYYWLQCDDCSANGPILDKFEDFLDPVRFHKRKAVSYWNQFAQDSEYIDKTLNTPYYVKFDAQVVETR